MTPRWNTLPFTERMDTVEFRVHERPHIVVDAAICRDCTRI